MMKRIDTLWKSIFMGLALVAGMGLFVEVSAADDDVNENYYDFECGSGTTIPLNLFENTHIYLLDNDAETTWSSWTAKNKYDGQTLSWSDIQTVESVYYFVDNISPDMEVMFTFTAGSETRYKSINSTSNGTWMQVSFDSIDASSVYIERVDENGGDVTFFEMRVCVTAKVECAPGNIEISPNTPTMGDTDHFVIDDYTFSLDGDFSDCGIVQTEMQLDNETCATGEVLNATPDQIIVRFRKHTCFPIPVVEVGMGYGPEARLIIGDESYTFDLRYCPNNESIYFIH